MSACTKYFWEYISDRLLNEALARKRRCVPKIQSTDSGLVVNKKSFFLTIAVSAELLFFVYQRKSQFNMIRKLSPVFDLSKMSHYVLGPQIQFPVG